MTRDDIILHIEAVLLAAGRPVRIEELLAIFNGHEDPPDRKAVREAVADLAERWRDRSLELSEVASGFRAQIRQEFATSVSVLRHERPTRYSRALMETLALIVYRQPVSRGQIEEIRGVGVSNSIIKTLVEHDWIRVVGHREAPGRPALYGTTKHFLDSFNLKNLSALPPLGDIKEIEDAPVDLFAGLDEAMLDDPQSEAEEEGKEPPSERGVPLAGGAEPGAESDSEEPGSQENAPEGADISAPDESDAGEATASGGDEEGRAADDEGEPEGVDDSEHGDDPESEDDSRQDDATAEPEHEIPSSADESTVAPEDEGESPEPQESAQEESAQREPPTTDEPGG